MAARPVRLRAATRGSTLARWQTDHVAGLLRAADPAVEIEAVVVETTGDRVQDVPVWELGGTGVFVKEVQAAVLDGRADFAVHSAKDLPSSADVATPGLVIAAVPERADPRDCLVGSTLENLPPGGLVATGSVRRRAQLADRRPDLGFTGLRGNIQTRLEKASAFSAIVMATAALVRLGLEDRIAEVLEPGVMVPQVAQGALAVECREDDDVTRAALAAIEHGPSRRAVDAERGYLASLGGGCDLPVGAHATVAADGGLRVRGLMATLDGRVVLRDELSVAAGAAAAEAGATLARRLLDAGGSWLLEEAGMARGPQGGGGRIRT